MTDVQIETEPVAAAEIAGDRIDVLRAFATDLGERGETLGLIGPLEPPRLWTRHLLNSAILASSNPVPASPISALVAECPASCSRSCDPTPRSSSSNRWSDAVLG